MGIQNAFNCYSPTEDVLGNAPMSGLGQAWSAQELLKGTLPLMFRVAREGGWGYNRQHLMPLSSDELLKTQYTDEEMTTSPPFLPFAEDWLHATNVLAATQVNTVLPRILADGIPSTTYAAGANTIGGVADNLNYHEYMSNTSTWPAGKRNGAQRLWEHSDIKNLAFPYVFQIYENIVLDL